MHSAIRVRRRTDVSAHRNLPALYGQSRDGHDIVGFKEVCYGPREIELIRQCYPRASLLLLTRNAFDTWKSTTREWYPSLEAWAEQWKTNSRYFFELAQSDARCYFLRYEDLVGREKKAMEVLARAARITPEQASRVFAERIGSKNVGISEEEHEFILEKCRETMTDSGHL